MIYPWQKPQWQKLQLQIKDNCLPHALLLMGSEGLGKADFASHLAAALLCDNVDVTGSPCGECNACKLIRAETHPDHFMLMPEDVNKAIKVDDIRELSRLLTLTSQFGGNKVAVIQTADNMNISASNSLLKTLEEPSKNTFLILVSSHPDRLPITIRSRCQRIQFNTPDAAVASQWLQSQTSEDSSLLLNIAHGAPLMALKLSDTEIMQYRQSLMNALVGVAQQQSVTDYAESLSKYPSDYLLGWLYDWISDLLKIHAQKKNSAVINTDFDKELNKLAGITSAQALYSFLDQVITLRRVKSIPLNAQMMWEDLLVSWSGLLPRA